MICTPLRRQMLKHSDRQIAEESCAYRQRRFIQPEGGMMPLLAAGRTGEDEQPGNRLLIEGEVLPGW